MTSIWQKTVDLPSHVPLPGNIKTDIAIVGAGLTGCLLAWRLQQKGLRPILLEAATVGSGQTQNTTAKITCQHGLIYENLLQTFGEQQARQYAQANQQAIEEYRAIVRSQEIQCDFVADLPAYLYTTEGRETFEGEAAAAQSLGIQCEITTHTSLPFPVTAALKFPHQAAFHPLKFLKAISTCLLYTSIGLHKQKTASFLRAGRRCREAVRISSIAASQRRPTTAQKERTSAPEGRAPCRLILIQRNPQRRPAYEMAQRKTAQL